MGEDSSLAKLTVAVTVGNVLAAGAVAAATAYILRKKSQQFIETAMQSAAEEAMTGLDPLSMLTGGLSSEGGMDMGETGDIGTMESADTGEESGTRINWDELSDEE